MFRSRLATVGTRFTVLYAAVFLGSGVLLLAVALAFSGGSSTTMAPVQQQGGPAAARQRIAALEEQLDAVHGEQARRLVFGFAVALFVMAVLSLLLGRLMAGAVLSPVRSITAVTRRISADNLHERLAVHGPDDEVKQLADTIDGLLERLEASFTAQRRFVANASHELRTPLATMRATLDVAVAKPDPAAATLVLAGKLRIQLDRVDHLLDGFLTLARAQHGGTGEAAPNDLAELVAAALRDRAAEVSARRLAVTVELPAGSVARGNPALLARLVANLVDNAVTHNVDDGWVRITGGESELIVESGGRVFAQDQVDRLTGAFERLGEERVGSSGLGLSIVAAVVAAHQGTLELTARPDGGLRAAVRLP
ncbi:sensor histidine kinase [Actinoplanes flavus]|uniref:histidine kinase n=1 Tax=Actinoplanes flavus TaxID=2820290 RepID=A0ABS3UK10_9ACTN|nr:HAMP domain-containing sensor histidine kinase [Actinoplanes flavus]MBO3739120.1 HAMP domain-containing histidine kinase [Actinoplanes flavus]